MATRVTWELTAEERRKLARDLMVEILAEFENALFSAQERAAQIKAQDARAELKAAIRDTLLEVIWEMEQYLPDPDEGLSLRPEFAKRLEEASRQASAPLDDVKRELGLDG